MHIHIPVTPNATAYDKAQHIFVIFCYTLALRIAKPSMAVFSRVFVSTLCDSSGTRPLS